MEQAHPAATASAAGHPRSDIFICYRKDDSAGSSGRLLENLRTRFGHSRVFFDASAIGGGERYQDVIDAGLARAAVFLPVIGERWLELAAGSRRRIDLEDDVLRGEIETALREGISIIPVLLEETRMPSPADLPASIAGLAAYQAQRLRHETWDVDVARLLAQVERKLSPPGRWNARGAGRRVLAGALVALGTAGAWYALKDQSGEADIADGEAAELDSGVVTYSSPGVIAAGRYGRATGEITNLRTGPSATAPRGVMLQKGVVFEILEQRGIWMRVRLPSGNQGWIASPFVAVLDSAADSAERSAP